MLVLNPENLQATRDPLLPKTRLAPTYALIARLTLAALAGIAALSIGYGVTQVLTGTWPFWAGLLPVAAFVYLATMTTVVNDEATWNIGFSAVWGACFALALPWRSLTEALALMLIVAIASISAYASYRYASSTYTTLHLFSLARRYASSVATGVVIALIVLYGVAVTRGSAFLPQGVLAGAADRAANMVPTFLPGVTKSSPTSTLTISDLALASARSQLEADPRYRALGPAEQQRVLQEAADSAAASLVKQLGVNASTSASVGTVAQGTVTNVIQGFQEKYGWYFTVAWLLGAFFIARSAAVVLTLAVAVLTWLTVTACISLGLLRIEAVPSLHERISL